MIESQPQAQFKREIAPILKGIAKSATMTIYEGLPHQRWEPDALAKELKEQQTVTIHEYPFYAIKVTAPNGDARKLQELCRKRGTFQRSQGAKACGGFHPDWSLEFKDGPDVYHVHLCFGCQEARLYGPGSEVISDLSSESLRQLTALLKPLQKNRPERGEMLIDKE